MGFLVLRGPLCEDGSDFYLDSGETTVVGEAPKCQTCGRFYGMLPLVPPIRGKLVAERAVFDLSADVGGVLVSERCLRAFEERGITGLTKAHPIELLAIEGPFEFANVGRFFWAQRQWGAEIDRSRSNLRTTEKPCSSCGIAGLIEGYDRVAIIESSWDGRDLFEVKGLPGLTLVTDRVKDLCDRLKLKVCGLVPAEEYAVDYTKPPKL